MIITSDLFRKLPEESDLEYIQRVSAQKVFYKVTWQDIADTVEKETGITKSADTYRIVYGSTKIKDIKKEDIQLTPTIEDIEREKKETYGKKVDNIIYNRLLRQEGRFERFYHIISDKLLVFEPPKFEVLNCPQNDKEYVLGFADLHIGAKFSSVNNEYSMEIAKQRMEKAVAYCKDFVSKHNIRKLTVLDLGDEIQGMLRISDLKLNEVAVVDAFTYACRLIAQFLNELSAFCEVDFKMVSRSNHNQTRNLGTKASELASEDLGKILYNYIKDVLRFNSRVTVSTDVDRDYITFKIFDFNFIALHGHQVKNINTTIKDLSNLHRTFFDYAILAHSHSAKEFIESEGKNHDIETLVLPSFVGSCPYADTLMVGSKAGMKIFEFDRVFGHTASFKIILN